MPPTRMNGQLVSPKFPTPSMIRVGSGRSICMLSKSPLMRGNTKNVSTQMKPKSAPMTSSG